MPNTIAEPVRLGQTAEKVYKSLLQDIEDGTLSVNSRLPSERELCEQFGVNRGTLRKALTRLSEDGRVETRHGSGSHVCALPESTITTNIISVMCGDSLPDLSRLTMLAMSHGCTLGIYAQNAAKYDNELERLFLERVKQQRHRALLASCTPQLPHHDALLAELEASGTRLLHTEPYRLSPPDQNYLIPDYRRAGRAAVTALMVDGFRRIIYAGMDTDGPGYQLTRLGAEEILIDQGLASRPLPLINQDRRHGAYFHLAPGYLPEAKWRYDELAAAIDEPIGFVVPGLIRAEQIRTALAKRGIQHRIRVIGIEVSTVDSRHYADNDTYTFNRQALYQQAIELVSQADYPRIRELTPHQVWKSNRSHTANQESSP